MREQRRGRKIAMSRAEVDEFLIRQRTCRIATAGPDGPHLTPLWYVWDGHALWLNSIVKSQRWTDLERDPRVAALVDGGHEFTELHGVELRGRAERVGEVPLNGALDPEVEEPERLFARKYLGLDTMRHDGRHAWLRLVPEKIVSWDFRKM